MGFFDNVFTGPVLADGGAAKGILSYIVNYSGKTKATPSTALTLSAFYNGVEQISNDIAKLPKHVFRKTVNGRESVNSSINYLINTSPNDLMTAFDFWKVVIVTVILRGNAYALVHRGAFDGEIKSLEYLGGDSEVNVYRDEDRLFYTYDGETYHGEDILHFKAFSLDGIMGCSVVRFAAESLGVNLDAQNYVSEIYKDRGIGYGVIESEQSITNENKKSIEKGFSEKMAAGDKFRVPLLDSGLKYKSIAVTPAEAQFIETDKRAILEICRWLNIAPHKLKVLDNANFSNIYHQSIEHVQDSILPWLVRIEQEMKRKFFGRYLPDFYVKINEKMLLRGDLDAKQKFYATMVYTGVMARNEIRELEDLNPIVGLDEPLQPVNMELLSKVLNNKDLENEE